MKQWRVGTVSMGVSLILLGSVLFISQMKGKEAYAVLIDWWPVVFILLGVELLLYIAVSRMAQPFVKYDIFSVLFVGFICLASIGFAVLTSAGLMDELRYAVSSEEQTVELRDIVEPVPSTVKRILVQNNNLYRVSVDYTAGSSLHVFGSYQYRIYGVEERPAMLDSLVSVKTVGDTMYVRINRPPQHNGIHSNFPYMDVTIVLPDHIKAEVEVEGLHRLL